MIFNRVCGGKARPFLSSPICQSWQVTAYYAMVNDRKIGNYQATKQKKSRKRKSRRFLRIVLRFFRINEEKVSDDTKKALMSCPIVKCLYAYRVCKKSMRKASSLFPLPQFGKNHNRVKLGSFLAHGCVTELYTPCPRLPPPFFLIRNLFFGQTCP